MNLRKVKKYFAPGTEVIRQRKARLITVRSAGLSYTADETRFGSEQELAEHLNSKLPAITIRPQ